MGTLTFLHINSFTNNCTNKLFLWTTCMFSKEIKYWANGMGWGKLPPNAVKGPHCHSSPERGGQAVPAAVRAAEGGSSWRAKGSEGPLRTPGYLECHTWAQGRMTSQHPRGPWAHADGRRRRDQSCGPMGFCVTCRNLRSNGRSWWIPCIFFYKFYLLVLIIRWLINSDFKC